MGFLNFFSQKKKIVKHFRDLTDFMGTPEIEGIENISDARIFEIYEEVEKIMDKAYNVAKSQGTLNAYDTYLTDMVKIALIGEINGEYNQNLEVVRQNVSASWRI